MLERKAHRRKVLLENQEFSLLSYWWEIHYRASRRLQINFLQENRITIGQTLFRRRFNDPKHAFFLKRSQSSSLRHQLILEFSLILLEAVIISFWIIQSDGHLWRHPFLSSYHLFIWITISAFLTTWHSYSHSVSPIWLESHYGQEQCPYCTPKQSNCLFWRTIRQY